MGPTHSAGAMRAETEVEAYRFGPDGRFPNSALPVIVYRGALPADADAIEALLRDNGWTPAWRATIGFFPFDHFHSTAHELVAIVAGEARGRIGGPGGSPVSLRAGDAVLIPAGVCHFGTFSSADIRTLGAYPAGTEPDMRRGDPAEYEEVKTNAARVGVPATDPIHGAGGPLDRLWAARGAPV